MQCAKPRLAVFQLLSLCAAVLQIRQDFLHRCAVFALERGNLPEPRLDLRKPHGVITRAVRLLCHLIGCVLYGIVGVAQRLFDARIGLIQRRDLPHGVRRGI